MEPIYAQLLDLIETLEVVVEWLEVGWCKAPVEIDEEVAAVRE